MKTAGLALRTLALLIGFCCLCISCGDSAQNLADRVKACGTAEQWHTWAAAMVERSKTNSSPIRRSEMPSFVRRATPAGTEGEVWTVLDSSGLLGLSAPGSNGTQVVLVARFGGFESIGVVVGPPSYVERFDKTSGIVSKQIYPGVYVRAKY